MSYNINQREPDEQPTTDALYMIGTIEIKMSTRRSRRRRTRPCDGGDTDTPRVWACRALSVPAPPLVGASPQPVARTARYISRTGIRRRGWFPKYVVHSPLVLYYFVVFFFFTETVYNASYIYVHTHGCLYIYNMYIVRVIKVIMPTEKKKERKYEHDESKHAHTHTHTAVRSDGRVRRTERDLRRNNVLRGRARRRRRRRQMIKTQ